MIKGVFKLEYKSAAIQFPQTFTVRSLKVGISGSLVLNHVGMLGDMNTTVAKRIKTCEVVASQFNSSILLIPVNHVVWLDFLFLEISKGVCELGTVSEFNQRCSQSSEFRFHHLLQESHLDAATQYPSVPPFCPHN